MKSWRFSSFGSIAHLRLEEVPVPAPAKDECLVKVEFAALNPADRLLVMGRYPTAAAPPFSVGRDGCGTVAVPAASGRFKPGERVVCLRSIIGIERDGTLAEYVTVPEAHLAKLPKGWSAAEGAAGPHSLLTVWQALVESAALKPGESVLITGASGGIGCAAVILGHALGARVIALSRRREKQRRLLELGADLAAGPGDPDLAERVREAGGADVVIENVCGDFFETSLALANPYGRICVIGALGGTDVALDPTRLIFKRLQLIGIHVARYSDAGVQKAWADIVRLLAPLGRRMPIDRVFPFDEVPAAFEHLRRGPMGKVVIGPVGAGDQITA
jgi:NADPH2:quinone reductase